jgi:hypothetical protein
LEARWQALAEEVIVGMQEWRLQHPKATLTEIEAALDERGAKVRARFVQDAALVSVAADVAAAPAAERPRCAQCDRPLEARGQATRHLTTRHNQPLRLTRSYAVCPACGAGLFPPG